MIPSSRTYWVPPQSRFVTYEPRDEDWCRYFGICETRPVLYYEVRDEHCRIIGYTDLVADRLPPWHIQIPMAPHTSSLPYIAKGEVEYLTLEKRKYIENGKVRYVWYAPRAIAEKLLKSKYVVKEVP